MNSLKGDHQMKDMLKDMNYGSITFVVQDGKVIQIEKMKNKIEIAD
ncbi:YezD family protein [Bacillus licheniformis]|nr:YezD family protein [Bacillus licheniformis]